MTQADLIGALEADADNSSVAEAEYRREAADRIRLLAQERAFAFRRLNLMRTIAQAVRSADSEEIAVANGTAILCSKLGWANNEAHAAILTRFKPVAQAVFASLRSDGEPSVQDVLATLTEFESWYVDTHGASFWDLFERHMPETPLVDF